jgi:hypothetical protein
MRKLVKKIAVFMAVLLIASTFAVPQYSEAASAAPKLSVSKKTLTGVGTTYKLTVKNQKAGCKYAWKSSNTKIATVTASKGSATVTAVSKGTAKISCTITYSSGTKRVLTSQITVKVPATAVKISNAVLENNVHVIEMGDTYDFNRKITPSNSSDKTYWSVEPEEYGTIDKNGVFTPAKVGTFNIVATAADSKAKAAQSTVKDTILVSVVEKTAKVSSVALKGADELVVTFSAAIDPSTVLDTDTKQLTSAIVIAAGKDSKGNQASDFGALTGTLSSDQRVLTIKATNTFNGVYTINISGDILTREGIAITPYVKSISLVDKEPPTYIGSTLDDSGLKTTINFSEAIDVSSMAVAYTQSTSSTTTAVETALLTTTSNYVLSSDRKSLTIDLSSIALSNTSKTYTVTLQGVKDIAGNYSAQNFISVYVYYDTSTKPQATVVNITRTAYETVTVEFSRSIKPYGTGVLTVNGTPIYSASVDPDNNKLVNFTLPTEVAALSGGQTVSIQGWNAYNVASTDKTADTPISRVVNFSPDTKAPTITSSKLTSTNGVYTLTLEYSEPVTVVTTKGTLSAKIVTENDDIYPANNINYVATVDKKTVSLELESKQMTVSGKYEIAIPAGFVRDAYYNKSGKETVTVKSNTTADKALPAPSSIAQSTEDASIIKIKFDHKLDLDTAQTASNYTVAGAVVTKAEVVSNATTLAEVQLTLASGSIKYNANYPVTINGVKGYNNSYNAITNYTQTIVLKENVAPIILYAKLTANKDGVVLTFSEAVTGTAKFNVYLNGTIYRDSASTYVSYDTVSKTITIYFNSVVSSSSGLTLMPAADNNLKDANGNAAQINSTVYVY